MTKTAQGQTLVFLETAVRKLPQYIFWKDLNSIYLGCNDSYAQLLGLNSPKDIIGKTDLDIGWLSDGDSAELFRQGDRETMTGKYVINQEEWLSPPNGNKVLVLVNKGPIFDDNNNLLGVLGVATDITEKNRIEKELQETQHKLEGMTLVSASLAHELRTPLSSIATGIGSIKRAFPDLVQTYQIAEKANLSIPQITPSYFKMLDAVLNSISAETKAAYTFTEMLLENVSPSLSDSKKELFSIATCINDALARYPFKKGQKALISWDDKKTDFLVRGNNLFIIHVLFNLIKNALYYLAASGKSPAETKIEIWLEPSTTNNKLYFKDTGTGIPPDVFPYIFERFFSKTHRGAGIGLTYCKMAMESLGGAITCESVAGSFTQFTLVFPSEMSNN